MIIEVVGLSGKLYSLTGETFRLFEFPLECQEVCADAQQTHLRLGVIGQGPAGRKLDQRRRFASPPLRVDDTVRIFIDDKKQATGKTWENYYRFDPEASESGNLVSPVSKMLFRESGTATPANAGKGFLVDGVTLASS
jgi:hypothetical protein